MKNITCIAAAAILLGLLAGPTFAELKVVTTLSDLARIAEAVGGDDVEVETLCPGSRDPHYLPAKPSLARKLSKADLLCYNGLELEIGWLPLLIDKSRNPRVRPGSRGDLDCSRVIEHVLDVPTGPVDRAHGDIHPLGNPHYTLHPVNAAMIAQLMAERMGELDLSHADAYAARAVAFTQEIERRLPIWEAAAAVAKDVPVIIYHQHWNYLTAWHDLNVVGEIEHRPGISPSPRHVQNIIDKGRGLEQVFIVAAQWDHLDVAKEVAERIGAPLTVLPGYSGAQEGTEDYFTFIDTLCAGLGTAAAQASGERP